jgi:hypothetical protein
MATIEQSIAQVMLPETYMNITLDKVTNSSIGLSGRQAAEHMAVNTVYQIEVGMCPGKKYSTKREYLFTIEDAMNKGTSFTYTAPSPGPCTYQGDVPDPTEITLTDCTIGESTIYVNTTGVTANMTGAVYLVRAGSYIQMDSHPYQVAEDVAWTSNANVAVPVTRQIMEDQSGVSSFVVGNPTWTVKFAEAIPHTVQPHDRLQYSKSSVNFIEVL